MCYFDGIELFTKEYAVHSLQKKPHTCSKKLKVQFYCKGGFFCFPMQMFFPIVHNTNSVDFDIELIF